MAADVRHSIVLGAEILERRKARSLAAAALMKLAHLHHKHVVNLVRRLERTGLHKVKAYDLLQRIHRRAQHHVCLAWYAGIERAQALCKLPPQQHVCVVRLAASRKDLAHTQKQKLKYEAPPLQQTVCAHIDAPQEV